MNHVLGAQRPRSRIILATRELPPGPRGERRFFGNLQGRDWSVNVQLSVGRKLETFPIVMGAVRILTLVGSLDRDQYARITRHVEGVARGDVSVAGNAAWNTYNKILEHPGTSAILSALSAIPGAGQFTSTAFLAAKAVGAIGNDLTTAKRKRKKSGYTAKGVAQAANQALASSGKTVRLTSDDIERAVKAYFAMQNPPKGRARIRFLLQKPLAQSSDEYRELLALQFADEEAPAVELTPDSLDPIPLAYEVSGSPDAPCRCHVWSDTAGDVPGLDDSLGADDLLAGPGDRADDLVSIPDVPERGDTGGLIDFNDVAGPDDDLALVHDVAGPLDGVGGPAESFELAGASDLAGPLDEIDGVGGDGDASLDAPDASILDHSDGVGGGDFPDVEGPAEGLGDLAGPLDDGITAGAIDMSIEPGDGSMDDVVGPAESLADLGGPMDSAEVEAAGPLEPDLTPVAGPPPDADFSTLDDGGADISGAPLGLDEGGHDFEDPYAHRPGAFIGADFEPWTYAPE